MGIALRIVLIVFCMVQLQAFGLDETDTYLKNKPAGNTLDKSRWEKLKNGYKYKKPKIDKKAKEKSNLKMPIIKFDWKNALFYFGILVLLALAVYLVLRSGLFKDQHIKKVKKSFVLNEEPEDINDFEIDPLLEEALRLKDFRMAVRLKFLALLQMLNKHKHIEWSRDKTNLQYLRELKEENLCINFLKLCSVYEANWYGVNVLNEISYKSIAKLFDEIGNQLKATLYA